MSDNPSQFLPVELIDRFAGQAMQALIGLDTYAERDYLARDAYRYAIAMVEVRAKAFEARSQTAAAATSDQADQAELRAAAQIVVATIRTSPTPAEGVVPMARALSALRSSGSEKPCRSEPRARQPV